MSLTANAISHILSQEFSPGQIFPTVQFLGWVGNLITLSDGTTKFDFPMAPGLLAGFDFVDFDLGIL